MSCHSARRALDDEVQKKVAVLNCRIAGFGAINLDREIEPATVEAYAHKKSDLQESITRLRKEVDELKAQRKATQRHIAYKDLPADARFDRLGTHSKHLIDIIKMIAYRAETAMAQIVRQTMRRHDDARSLLPAVYSTEVDHVPDQEAKA
jgi:predicted fused transcriptional regulator/phosphomethylpyrimidine kinase